VKKLEREEQILQLLQAEGSVTVGQLSQLMEVSAVTIRSDLKDLEAEGVLLRTHGGAVLSEKVRRTVCRPENGESDKQTIGRLARGLIRENSWIFLGSGSTCLALAQELKDYPVNVMTNSLPVADLLSRSARGQVIMPGGAVFGSDYPFLYGDLLHASLDSVALSQAFLGVSGIDPDFGYSLSNAVECSIFARLRQISKEVVVLADASKFGKTSFMGAGPISVADTLVTAGALEDQWLDWCSQGGVKVVKPE